MIKEASTYLEWKILLDKFKMKESDDEVLSAMKNSNIYWQSGVAERFSKKLIDSVNYRMNNIIDRFQTEMTMYISHERELLNALLNVRKELKYLKEAMNLPCIPEKYRQQHINIVLKQADKMQSSLEESAKQDKTGKILHIIKNNKINNL